MIHVDNASVRAGTFALDGITFHIPAGVHAAPSDPKLVQSWMAEIDKLAQHLQVVDHLA